MRLVTDIESPGNDVCVDLNGFQVCIDLVSALATGADNLRIF